MAEEKKSTEESTDKKKKIREYEKVIDRLKEEKEELENQINREYRNARRYVRSHPEEGVLYAFAGGLAIGLILGRLGRR
ncbi:MAG: hypothetical protein ACOC4S_01320 [Balneolaceae bacterium]